MSEETNSLKAGLFALCLRTVLGGQHCLVLEMSTSCLRSCFSLEPMCFSPPTAVISNSPGVPLPCLACPAAVAASQSQDELCEVFLHVHSWETRSPSRPFILHSLHQDGTALVPAERRGPGDGTSCLPGPQGTQLQQQQQHQWWPWWRRRWWRRRQARDSAQPGP